MSLFDSTIKESSELFHSYREYSVICGETKVSWPWIQSPNKPLSFGPFDSGTLQEYRPPTVIFYFYGSRQQQKTQTRRTSMCRERGVSNLTCLSVFVCWFFTGGFYAQAATFTV